MHRLLVGLTLGCTLASLARADFADLAAPNWHRWRGPDATGVASRGNPPLHWDATTNVKWKVAVEGEGHATPIVWGDRIFIITAVDTGRPGPQPAAAADGATPAAADVKDVVKDDKKDDKPGRNVFEFKVICFDRNDGHRVWEKVACEALPVEGRHDTNTYASGSPTTDGQRLYVSFGSFGVFCYDLDGNRLWKQDLGQLHTKLEFGEGSSPTIHEDTLVINCDQEGGASFLTALNAATGEPKWKVPRDETTSWNTPLVVTGAGRTQVVVNGTNRARGYDIADGKLLWECGGQTANAIASPVTIGDTVICMSGFRGNAVFAIPLDAAGDITGTEKIAWHFDKAGPYVPSPILYDDRLYFTKSSNNLITCLDARTGEPYFDQERVDGLKNLYASPVGAAGRIYFTGRDGTTVVIRHADKLEVLATNELGEPVDASPAIVGNQIIIRSHEHLYSFSEE